MVTQSSIEQYNPSFPTFSLCFQIENMFLARTPQNYTDFSAYDLNQVTQNFSDIFHDLQWTLQHQTTIVTSYFVFSIDLKCFRVSTDRFDNHRNNHNIAALYVKSYRKTPLLFFEYNYDYMNFQERPRSFRIDRSSFLLAAIATQVQLLPYPYETNCYDYIFLLSQKTCIEQCLQYNMYAYYGIRLKGTYFSFNRVAGQIRNAHTTQIYRACQTKCHQVACFYSFESWISVDLIRVPRRGLYIKPNTFSFEIRFLPKESLTQFVLLLTGVMGLWLGLDMISIWSSLRIYYRRWRKLKLKLWRLAFDMNASGLEIRITF